MRIQKLVIGILLAISVLLIVSCSKEKDSPLPEASTANEVLIAVPAPVAPPGITPGPMLPTGRENVYSVQIDLVPSKQVYLPGGY